ncbi:MAG TPA: penicillin-binding protein 1C [Rhizomicrobium sp.]|nr:penicillin-binding protein 1C [Rhizomicrobium sp.]
MGAYVHRLKHYVGGRKRAVIAMGVSFAFILLSFLADIAFPPDMSRYRILSPEVVDRHGVLLRPFLSKDGYWRLKTTAAEVNPRYLKLLEAYEDKRFASHWGVDPFAMIRAVIQLGSARRVVSGGSTLTMQAARLLEPRPRGIGAKLIQMVRAVQLEERYSKDEILSIYLTLAPFGGNLEGVRAASLAYFGKPPSALDLSESALLVALPQSPARDRPDRHGLAAIKGRDKVLARMVDEGVITPGDAAVARREGVASMRLPMPLIAPHLAQHLKRAHPNAPLLTSTIDASLQTAIERMATRERAYLEDGGSLAIVVVDNRTRNVLAYVGGTDYWGRSGQIDLAARPRSPGSALKPFIYGLAFDDLILHPSSRMEDEPMSFGDYAPRDFEGSFQGAVTAAEALRMSLNVPAVTVLDRVGPLRFSLALENAGAHLAYPTKDTAPSLPIALGGLGISLADITMLYAGIAEGGDARPLNTLANAPSNESHCLFGPVAAWYLRDILDGVSLPEGWAMGQGLARKRTIGFKTGTSYGFRDAWSVGFSNDYTVGVWVGRADGAPSAGRIGREAAAPILLKTFGLLPDDKRRAPQPPPGTILVRSTEELPPNLRVFTRESAAAPVAQQTSVPPPSIAFPPNGATVQLPAANARDKTILFKADGGRAPLTWLVDGQPLGTFDRFQPVIFAPKGEGFARVTVVDAEGRSDSAKIRFKKPQ